ncbi:hypothetical protein [Nonlabens antarcticus]|uniref:hypothetical protein n=1 Tax=Nonlabens antarcticus TaxID=392714 RepID=UPI001890FC64|nr:hypothetical protein [Nonlabens antarcticus]
MIENNKPPLFTAKSLRIFTRIVAIYAGFYIITVIAKTISDPLSENPLAPSNGYAPLYFLAGVHLLMLGANLAIVLTKNFNWFVPSISAAIMILSRVYYEDIALWVWSWT